LILRFYNQKGIQMLGVINRQSVINVMYAHKLNIVDPLSKQLHVNEQDIGRRKNEESSDNDEDEGAQQQKH